MNGGQMFQQQVQSRIKSRSMGLKLFIVCGLALVMTIPAFFVDDLVDERTHRANDVVKEISSHVGGSQTFLGPTLAIPYSIPPSSPDGSRRHGVYLVFPAQASAAVKTQTAERRRSLFKVPVFQADLNFTASFDLNGVPASAGPNVEFDWSRAEFIVGVSDARGALTDGTLTVGGKTVTLAPADVSQSLSLGEDQAQKTNLSLFGARAIPVQPNTQFSATATLRFSGAQRIAVLAYGKSTQLSVQGDWANPSFDGGFLPVGRNVTPSGFTANWTVPFIARGVRAEGTSDSITGLESTALGVSFIEVADPYQSVTRSLKFILLFNGLIFLSYFVFEVTTNKRVHPAQYALVGVAQIIFYLLLLSLAERIGFDFGFLIAGSATVVLLSTNAGWIFASRVQAIRALSVFSVLYALIYMLLRLEDNALLVGAVASFAAVALAMYLTRSIDWYGSLPDPATPGQ
ncbi:MAG: cell envelope integrity protein CreD [Acidobacteria bacterium]|nr:cell envelope integrity protein CreD [Acidobacteriota bacterium]